MSWHVLTVQPMREHAVALRLAGRWPNGYGTPPEAYVPLEAERRRPLYPGYVMIRCDEEQLPYARTFGGFVSGILGPASDAEIEITRAIELQGATQAEAGLQKGRLVTVRLFGTLVEGSVISEHRGKVRLLVSGMLGGASVEVDRKLVKVCA